MGDNVRNTAGSSISISASLPATEDQAGYEALSFTLIAEVTNIGDIGATYSKTEHSPLDTARIQKLKGSYDPGLLNLQMGADISDAGQTLLQTARDTYADYSFKLTDANGDNRYFKGLVMNYTTTYGANNDVISATAGVEINSDPVYVAAP